MILLRKKSDPKWLRVVNQTGSIVFMVAGIIVSAAAGLAGNWAGDLVGGLLGAIAWMPLFLLIRLAALSLSRPARV